MSTVSDKPRPIKTCTGLKRFSGFFLVQSIVHGDALIFVGKETKPELAFPIKETLFGHCGYQLPMKLNKRNWPRQKKRADEVSINHNLYAINPVIPQFFLITVVGLLFLEIQEDEGQQNTYHCVTVHQHPIFVRSGLLA
ncbi:MAG: hypothetical protein GY702_28565 [Desulfobulbaceae bacterium]|nr:hypothetical protein [Desulfobulbaceae bacterium]